jgi:hypothetical protein
MERWWDETEEAKPQYCEQNVLQGYFSRHKYHRTELKLNPSLRGERLANSRLSLGTTETDVYLN